MRKWTLRDSLLAYGRGARSFVSDGAWIYRFRDDGYHIHGRHTFDCQSGDLYRYSSPPLAHSGVHFFCGRYRDHPQPFRVSPRSFGNRRNHRDDGSIRRRRVLPCRVSLREPQNAKERSAPALSERHRHDHAEVTVIVVGRAEDSGTRAFRHLDPYAGALNCAEGILNVFAVECNFNVTIV